ncbi:MAG: PfkB family carbohydrate kinase [Thalassobaculales bacterium]
MRPPRKASDKILDIAAAAGRAAALRAAGQRVVLAHGVFDLLHLGHVRHLEEARRHGDLLFVSITPDRFVRKGPGRPAFAEAMRAEMLAALECVDHVLINDAPSAEGLIRRLQPDCYVKGKEYAKPEDDVTAKIIDEQAAVEAHGGRIVFTDDVVFSSSALINRYVNTLPPPVRQAVDSVRAEIGLDGVLDGIERIKGLRVLVIGDTIIDEYNYVEPMGQASKDFILATRFKEQESFAGGVIAAANHLATFCAEVEVLTSLGAGDPHNEIVRRNLRPAIGLTAIERPGAATTRKSRAVETGYMRKLFEVQVVDDTPLPADLQARFDTMVAEKAAAFDLVIVTDFGHGLIARSTIDILCREARFLAVNAQSNSANRGFNLITKYPRADYICIDGPEALLAVGDKFVDRRELVASRLPAAIDCRRIIVTHGKHGCVAREAGNGVEEIPAITDQIVDTMGAGDAFFVLTAPLAAIGMPLRHVGFIGNVVGALKVGILGHRASVDKASLVKALTGLLK